MLKLLACLFMLIDHVGVYFQEALPPELYWILRCIGRLAFPIFAWSVARGCARTKNPFHYFLRMAIFAVLTEIMIRLLNQQPGIPQYPTNILITFSLAIVLIYGYQMATRASRDMIASMRPISATPNTLPMAPRFDVRISPRGIDLDSRAGLVIGILMIALALTGTYLLMPDYNFFGLFTVLFFFIVQERVPEESWLWRAAAGYLAILLAFWLISLATAGFNQSMGELIECLSIFALPLCVWRGGGKKPSTVAKYAVYVFYPLHILILGILHTIVFPI